MHPVFPDARRPGRSAARGWARDRPHLATQKSPCSEPATDWISRSAPARLLPQGLVRGDLGVSIEYGRPVTALLAERLPATVLLGGSVLLLNFTVGLWLGVRQAVRRGRREDRWLTTRRWPATPCRPSGWAWCSRGWSVFTGGCSPRPGMQDPLLELGRGPGRPRAADVLRHLVLPGAHPLAS